MVSFHSLIKLILTPHYSKLEPMLSELFDLNMTLHRSYHNVISYQGKLYVLPGYQQRQKIIRSLHKSLIPSMELYCQKFNELSADESFLAQELIRLSKVDKSLVHARAQLPTFTLTRLLKNPTITTLAYTEISALLDITEFPELAIEAVVDKIHLYTALEIVT